MSFEIRPVQPADREGVRRVIAAAFGGDGGDGGDGKRVVELVSALDAAGHTRVSLVAEVQGVVSGHVQLSTSWVDARERLVEVLVLSPLSVIPGQQRRGMGGALVSAAIASAAQMGAPAVFLEGSPDYYGPRGFAPGAAHGFVRPSIRIPGRAFQVMMLDHHESWMTGALVYCDPFWKLDCVGLRDPLLAQLEEGRGPT